MNKNYRHSKVLLFVISFILFSFLITGQSCRIINSRIINRM